MLQLTPPGFVPTGQAIQFPPGTVLSYDGGSWALYVNSLMNKSWMAYATPAGTKVVPMGGVRRVRFDFSRMDKYIQQRQAAGCFACDE